MKPSDLTATEYFKYYKQYVDLVDDVTLLEALQTGLINTSKFFDTIPKVKLLFQYTEGKWTPKEILLHLIDAERVFSYRALYFARAANSSLEGFDENEFGANCNANDRTLDDLLKEYKAVRTTTIHLFESFNNSVLKKGGIANNNSLSVRACGFIICGHEKHHRKIIEERYL
jgi:hypothetical protein